MKDIHIHRGELENMERLVAAIEKTCAKCKAKLTENQIAAVGMLHRGGFMGLKAYCSECWKTVGTERREPKIKINKVRYRGE